MFRLGMGKKRAGVAGRDGSRVERGLDGGGQVKQTQRIADMGTRLPHGLGEPFLSEPEFLDQAVVALCLFEGVEVLALEVLHQGDGERVRVGEVSDQSWSLMQPRQSGGAPAALPGDDLKSSWSGWVRPCYQRL